MSRCLPFVHGRLRRLRRFSCSSPLLETLGSDWNPNGTWIYSHTTDCAITSPISATLPPKWLTDRSGKERRSKGERAQKCRGEDSAPMQFQKCKCYKKSVWNQKYARLLLLEVGELCTTAKEEEIWVQEEVEKEVQLDERFRPSSRGLFRQKTNITQPTIDRCCCSDHKQQRRSGEHRCHQRGYKRT